MSLHITSFDFFLMIIILVVIFIEKIQTMCRVVKECFIFESIMIGLIIAGALGAFNDSVDRHCIVKNTDFFKTFKNFQTKFHETFRDTNKFMDDMRNYKKEFAEVLTHILKSEHDTSKINLLGYTECQTNVRLFKYFLGTLFQATGTLNDDEIKKQKLISNAQIVNFLKLYNTLPHKLQFPEDLNEIDENNTDEQTLKTIFKEIVLYDPLIGLTSIMQEFHGFFDEYVKIENLKLSKGSSSEVKEEKKKLYNKVKKTYDNNTTIFKMWDDDKNTYKNKINIMTNIKRPYFEKIFVITEDTILNEMEEFIEGCKRDPKDIWKRPMYANKTRTNVDLSATKTKGSNLNIREVYNSL